MQPVQAVPEPDAAAERRVRQLIGPQQGLPKQGLPKQDRPGSTLAGCA
jgi:hypothetical protein